MSSRQTGAYYNEIDPFAAAWLRELIKAGLIADGEVDERSIEDVATGDVRGFVQCHFFAGIGGWSYALRLAGWDDSRPVWTGSCPCQPFSSAGAQAGGSDPRDLWPAWFQLVTECRPDCILGEQVEAAIGHGWLDRLCDDLEGEGYAVGACGLPAASVGAFHIRQRLWFVGALDNAEQQRAGRSARSEGRAECAAPSGREDEGRGLIQALDSGADDRQLADAAHAERRPISGSLQDERDWHDARREETRGQSGACRPICGVADAESRGQRIDGRTPRDAGHVDERESVVELGDADDTRSQGWGLSAERAGERATGSSGVADGTFWSACDWLPCTDGKARPVEPGTFPLAHGVPARVGRLRGYGNAIVPQVAQAFIEAYLNLSEDPADV